MVFLRNRKWRVKILFIVSISLMLIMVGCSTNENINGIKNESLSCSTDSDCVPNSCCHAHGAVNSAYGPSCSSMLCTMACEPGTLDCSQGEIKCVNSTCTVSIYE